jgi:hypothetical protein
VTVIILGIKRRYLAVFNDTLAIPEAKVTVGNIGR